jgi:hypothetical protein
VTSKDYWVVLHSKVLSNGHVDCRSERLPEDEDARRWNFRHIQSPVNDCDSILYQAILCWNAWSVSEASVVESQNMDSFWTAGGEGAIVGYPMTRSHITTCTMEVYRKYSSRIIAK